VADTDGDGYSDGEEIEAGTDPLNSSDHPDNGDGTPPPGSISFGGFFLITAFSAGILLIFSRQKDITKKY